MSFALLHKIVTYIIAGLGLLVLSLGGDLGPLSQIFLGLSFVGSIFVEGKRLDDPSWQRGWTIGFFAAIFIALVRGFAGEAPLTLALELTAILQITRLFNRRSAAEHQQIAMLAFLHLCAATVLSVELSYGVGFVGFVFVTPWMLALTHLRADIEANIARDSQHREEDVRRVLASKRLVGPSFLLGTAVLSLPLVAMTAILFVAFPRVGIGMLAIGPGSPSHFAGFGDDVRLGEVGLIRGNPTVVLRVIPPGVAESPPRMVSLRMRGTSFDHYDGERWSRLPGETISIRNLQRVYPVLRDPSGQDERWEIAIDQLSEPVVFLPPRAVALEIPGRIENGIERDRGLLLSRGLDIRYDRPDALGLSYIAFVGHTDWRAPEALSDRDHSMYLQLPSGHERVAELAREWTDADSSPRAKIEALVARLHRFEYSLQMRAPDGRPPLISFLDDWHAGHCEYFSTALAIMSRSLGIPSRNVTGFLGGQWNAYGRYYALVHSDAHSWVEVYLANEGWVSFDPTPPGRDAVSTQGGLLGELSALLDALRAQWQRAIVNYDLNAQRSLAFQLWRSFGSRGGGARFVEDPSESPAWSWGTLLLVGGGSALGLALVLWWRLGQRRPLSRHSERAMPPDQQQIVEVYRALEEALRRLGHPRPLDRTPLEHAIMLHERPFGGLVRELTERYLEVRFGESRLADGELETLRSRIAELPQLASAALPGSDIRRPDLRLSRASNADQLASADRTASSDQLASSDQRPRREPARERR